MLDFLVGGNPWFWLIALIFFLIAEGVSVSAVSIWFAIGSLASMSLSFVTQSFTVEVMIFLLVSILTLLLFRNWALTRFKIGSEKTGTDLLLEQQGVVLTEIKPLEPGTLKIEGKTWRCQSLSKQTYEVGDIVIVRELRGVTIWVD